MSKNIWNSGDIITTEKWNNILNNYSILGAQQLSITQTLDQEENLEIIINHSYNEIVNLLKQGIICYFIIQDNNNIEIYYIELYYNKNHRIYANANGIEFFFHISEVNSNKMVNYYDGIPS